MTDTADRLAALLRDLDMIPDKTAADDHIPDMEWAESHSRVIAARLIAAGVTLAAPLDEQGWKPDVVLPEGTFPPRDRRTRHATPAPLDAVRGGRDPGPPKGPDTTRDPRHPGQPAATPAPLDVERLDCGCVVDQNQTLITCEAHSEYDEETK